MIEQPLTTNYLWLNSNSIGLGIKYEVYLIQNIKPNQNQLWSSLLGLTTSSQVDPLTLLERKWI